MNKSHLSTFIISLLSVSYLGEIYIILNGGIGSRTFNTLAPILMFLPAIWTIAYLFITKKGLRNISWKVGKPIYLLYAAIVPSAIAIIAALLISSFGWGEISHFKVIDNQVEIYKGRFVLGSNLQSLLLFILNYTITTLIFSLVSGVVAFGEELGWRGFLQKHLIHQNGLFGGVITLGLIWGFWHFPLILNGYNYPDSPMLGAFLLFPLTTIFASFFLAWLTMKANSFWPAVIAHGSVNAFIGSIVAGMNYGDQRLYADIFMVCIWGIVATFSYMSLRKMDLQIETNEKKD